MTFSISPARFDEIKPFLLDAMRFDTTAGAVTIADYVQADSLLFKMLDHDDAVIGGYALSVAQASGGKVVWLEYAAGRAKGIQFTDTFFQTIEQQARDMGAVQLAFTTCRLALIKKMRGIGFAETGTVLRKNL